MDSKRYLDANSEQKINKGSIFWFLYEIYIIHIFLKSAKLKWFECEMLQHALTAHHQNRGTQIIDAPRAGSIKYLVLKIARN